MYAKPVNDLRQTVGAMLDQMSEYYRGGNSTKKGGQAIHSDYKILFTFQSGIKVVISHLHMHRKIFRKCNIAGESIGSTARSSTRYVDLHKKHNVFAKRKPDLFDFKISSLNSKGWQGRRIKQSCTVKNIKGCGLENYEITFLILCSKICLVL